MVWGGGERHATIRMSTATGVWASLDGGSSTIYRSIDLRDRDPVAWSIVRVFPRYRYASSLVSGRERTVSIRRTTQ